jgi:hypothetical protein
MHGDKKEIQVTDTNKRIGIQQRQSNNKGKEKTYKSKGNRTIKI